MAQKTRCQKEQELLPSVSLLYLNIPFKHPSSVVFLMLSGPLLPYTSHVQHFYVQIFCKQMGYQIHYVSNKISQRCILLYILKFLLVRISFCMILLMTEILHQLIVYPIIYRVLYIPRCDRRISEPSTILDFLDRQAEIVPSNLVVVGDLRCKKKPSRNQPKITKSKNWKIATSG